VKGRYRSQMFAVPVTLKKEQEMRDHEFDEINQKLRDIQGKAAFEFWKVNILQASWMTDRWEDLSDDRRQQWVGLCEAETRAFLDAYPSLMEPYLRARGYPVSEGLPGERSEPGSAECLNKRTGRGKSSRQ